MPDAAIGWAASKGITKGCSQGRFGDGVDDRLFCPTKPVTRGQMAALLYRHVEADYQGQASTYEDIDPSAYYAAGVAWLTDFAVVPGCESNLFCPSHNATRAEAALFIHGVAIRPHMWGAANTDFIPQSQ